MEALRPIMHHAPRPTAILGRLTTVLNRQQDGLVSLGDVQHLAQQLDGLSIVDCEPAPLPAPTKSLAAD